MDDHLTKPIDPGLLYQTLARWIDISALAPLPQEKALHREDRSGAFPKQLPGLDLEGALERVSGDEKLLLDILLQFSGQFEGVVLEMAEMLRAGRLEELRQQAHTLKGVAGNVGAMTLYQRASAIDGAIRSGASDISLAELEEALVQVFGSIANLASSAEGEAADGTGASAAADLVPLLACLEELDALLGSHSYIKGAQVEQMRQLAIGTPLEELAGILGGQILSLGYADSRKTIGVMRQRL